MHSLGGGRCVVVNDALRTLVSITKRLFCPDNPPLNVHLISQDYRCKVVMGASHVTLGLGPPTLLRGPCLYMYLWTKVTILI